MLDYRVAWYHKGKVAAVVPNAYPETTYLVDVDDNHGEMSCTCDTYMFKADPQKVGPQNVNKDPCRHVLLVRALIRTKMLPS